jgi:hypothetical protein
MLLGAAMLGYVYFVRYGGDTAASGGAASLSTSVTRSIG